MWKFPGGLSDEGESIGGLLPIFSLLDNLTFCQEILLCPVCLISPSFSTILKVNCQAKLL